ncbi:hypothetical protein GCM10023063_16100 [Arthrobacter methylotrophus]|uniref:Uncharacterized protein n=1 Tax=Arthrobacter methylotrophus TaxID=121291 RepID=A0ABV5UND5_9MICC
MTTTTDPAEARDYLSDHLNLEAEEHPADEDWYYALEDHLLALEPSHPICTRLAVALEPFLNDDERIDCTMYPQGKAVNFLDEQSPRGSFSTYLEGLTSAIEADHERWVCCRRRSRGLMDPGIGSARGLTASQLRRL